MKKFFGMVVAIAGVILTGWAAYCIMIAGGQIYGYHAMYPGLLGLAMLTGGIIVCQE